MPQRWNRPAQSEPPAGRRDALRLLGAAASGVLVGMPSAVGCGKAPPAVAAQTILRVELAELPLGRRVVVSLAGRPVEVLRGAAGVAARSLLCTHFGCRVAWDEPSGTYVCPCHDGRFDASGRPIAGPPREPLPEIPLRVDGPTVVLGG